VDCDIHQTWASPDEVAAYLPDRYRDRGIGVPEILYKNPTGWYRDETVPGDGRPPASSVEELRRHHLDATGIEYGVLTGNSGYDLTALPNRDYATALARAYNRWQAEEWLAEDSRLLGSLYVAPQDPEGAAEIIREMGSHPQVVQVLLPSGAQLPYGQPFYWPMYEAAAELGLPVALHPFSEGHGVKHPPTGAGHPNTYFEWHSLLGTYYMGQLASIITEGVFDEFTDLDYVFVEGGFGWVPHFMWRLDKNWKSLRSQAPWLTRPPSEYVRENVRFTSQPMEEPEDPAHLVQVMEMMHADDTLLFASDFPHWDGDSPVHGFPPLPEETRRNVFSRNARELYDLPDPAEGSP
jgi:predicted TIM-barrel fold metal-dependent hydrolase